MELVNYFKDNTKMLSDLFSIISYLSTFPAALKAFHSSGKDTYFYILKVMTLLCYYELQINWPFVDQSN